VGVVSDQLLVLRISLGLRQLDFHDLLTQLGFGPRQVTARC
jgi:hypothetical protein